MPTCGDATNPQSFVRSSLPGPSRVPIRDIGTVVNVSYQRVEQIAQQGAPVAKTENRAAAPHSGTTTRTKTSR